MASHHDDVKGFISWRYGIRNRSIVPYLAHTVLLPFLCPHKKDTCSLVPIRSFGWAAEWGCMAVQYVPSVLTFDSSVCLLGCHVVPVSRCIFKTREWEWHSSRGCNPRFYWQPLSREPSGRGVGAGGGHCDEPNMLQHMKRPGWPFPLRPLDVKTGPWQVSTNIVRLILQGEHTGLGATLTVHWTCLHFPLIWLG